MPELDTALRASRVLDAIGREPWLITADAFAQILAIAERANEAPEAIATRLGRPLDNTRQVRMHGNTALIPITGPIFRYANLFTEISGATSLDVLARDFQEALDNPAVSSIVLEINSPGGQATGIAEFASLVRAADKPVAAYVGDLAASAAYWIASHAHNVVLSQTGMVGSIGVVATYRPEKDAPIEIISTQSPLKHATPDTEAGRNEAQRIVDELANVFITAVAEARGISPESVTSDFGRGSLLVGQYAIDAGMADRIASLNSILAGASSTNSTRRITMSEKPTAGAPTIDRAYLDINHADLVLEILAEGDAAGRKAGADAERTRILSVNEQLVPGHEALIKQLAFDGHTTGPEAAVQVLAAERELREKQQRIQNDAPPAVVSVEGAEPGHKETFDDKLAAYAAEGMSKAAAMRKAVSTHPELHKAWLARLQGERKAG